MRRPLTANAQRGSVNGTMTVLMRPANRFHQRGEIEAEKSFGIPHGIVKLPQTVDGESDRAVSVQAASNLPYGATRPPSSAAAWK